MNKVHVRRKLGVTSLLLTQGSAELDVFREKLGYLQFVEPIPQIAVEALNESYVPFVHHVLARRLTDRRSAASALTAMLQHDATPPDGNSRWRAKRVSAAVQRDCQWRSAAAAPC